MKQKQDLDCQHAYNNTLCMHIIIHYTCQHAYNNALCMHIIMHQYIIWKFDNERKKELDCQHAYNYALCIRIKTHYTCQHACNNALYFKFKHRTYTQKSSNQQNKAVTHALWEKSTDRQLIQRLQQICKFAYSKANVQQGTQKNTAYRCIAYRNALT